MTVIENKLVVDRRSASSSPFVIYLAIQLFAGGAQPSPSGSRCRRRLLRRRSRWAGSLIASRPLSGEPHDEFRYQARGGLHGHRGGPGDRASSERAPAAGRDLARRRRARSAYEQFEYALDTWSPGCSSSPPGAHSTSRCWRRREAWERSAGRPMRKAPRRPRRSGPCAIRSTRTSCSIR